MEIFVGDHYKLSCLIVATLINVQFFENFLRQNKIENEINIIQ